MAKQVELPEPATHWPSALVERSIPLFTADQMRQYADDCVKEELRKIELEKKDGRE